MLKCPIVTYDGDHVLFNSLQAELLSSLPLESVDWRRSYGRPTRSVHVEVTFCQFLDDEIVSKEQGKKSIFGKPVFHTFWTDCSDLDQYKNSLKEKLQSWLSLIRANQISDWMVILVETPDSKKTNKLIPRTTVLDKIKSDFGGKQPERCISLIDQTKSDSKSAESWQLLLMKMRHMIMVAYNRALNKFEEVMRFERERRNDRSWSFCKYFLLQEELALVYQLLALYDESLVQYDELDALFTQFVLNSKATVAPQWLSAFRTNIDHWEGLHLSKNIVSNPLHDKMLACNLSLLEFRNYLFQRQSSLLFKLDKPWELAARALAFLQNTPGEMKLLQINIVDGGIACWGFLSCLEVALAMGSQETDIHAMHTAPLWAYAREKLRELGNLCGLMAGDKTSSEQLHIVISLVCGMGEDPHEDDDNDVSFNDDRLAAVTIGGIPKASPMAILKEALSSQDAFKKHFLNLSEVSISTYKHIGRIRSARLIGRDLALFYMNEGSPHLAASFLMDQLKTFIQEGWDTLAAHTRVKLLRCYRETCDWEKYIKTAIHLACSQVPSVEEKERLQYFEDLVVAEKKISSDIPLMIPSEGIFEIGWVKVVSKEQIIIGSEVTVEIMIDSRIPVEITLLDVSLQLIHQPHENHEKPPLSRTRAVGEGGERTERKASNASSLGGRKMSLLNRVTSENETNQSASVPTNFTIPDECDNEESFQVSFMRKLSMKHDLDYKQDSSLATASVHCLNPHKVLRRQDSAGGVENLEIKNFVKGEFTDSFSTKDVTLKPMKNIVQLKTRVLKSGFFLGGQVCLQLGKVEFLCSKGMVRGKSLFISVINQPSSVNLRRKDCESIAGITQDLVLTIRSGSQTVENGTVIHLKASRGLMLGVKLSNIPFKERLMQPGPDVDEAEKNENLKIQKNIENDSVPNSAEPMKREIEISLPLISPFEETSLNLECFADLAPQKDASTIEHTLFISSNFLSDSKVSIPIHFIPPFMFSQKLFTAGKKKFIQVLISGLVPQVMRLSNAKLSFRESASSDVSHPILKYLNSPLEKLVVCSDQTASYMWEMLVDYSISESIPLKAEFLLGYEPVATKTPLADERGLQMQKDYFHSFDVKDYKTLYTIRSRVEPTKGSEFCRAGNMCNLHISLSQVEIEVKINKDDDNGEEMEPNSRASSDTSDSIMYEVIVDQSMWAVCGRTAGVFSLSSILKESVVLDVIPLIGGFLPLPSVRLSRYIPADVVTTKSSARERKSSEIVGNASSMPRLSPFSPGQVYNYSKAMQVHVLPSNNSQQDIN